jgi:propanol-preferring alcohol dehydrogenase
VLRTERSLDDVNEAIEQVLDGSAPAPRLVFDMLSAPATSATSDRASAGV